MGAVCFTGHRRIEDDLDREKLDRAIERAIEIGCDTFIFGGALGFDTLAAEIVLSKKKKYPNIKLHLYLPCRDQSSYWSYIDRLRYHNIREAADYVDEPSYKYFDGCMRTRNYKMVDNANICICYLNSTGRSGTAQTVRYALKRGMKVANVSSAGQRILNELESK